jgi:hypothetical protein
MTERRNKEPIESFGPELMNALREGGRPNGRVIIRFDRPDGVGKKFAHTFQRRIHTLRQRMRDLGHPDYPVAMRAQVRLVWGKKSLAWGAPSDWASDDHGKKGALIVITPRDSEFAEFVSPAHHITPPTDDVAKSPQPTQPPTPTKAQRAKADYDDFLDELERQQSNSESDHD